MQLVTQKQDAMLPPWNKFSLKKESSAKLRTGVYLKDIYIPVTVFSC